MDASLNMDKNSFVEGIGKLADLFNYPMSAQQLSLYWDALKDLPADRVKGAMAMWVKTGKKFPLPAELRELAV